MNFPRLFSAAALAATVAGCTWVYPNASQTQDDKISLIQATSHAFLECAGKKLRDYNIMTIVNDFTVVSFKIFSYSDAEKHGKVANYTVFMTSFSASGDRDIPAIETKTNTQAGELFLSRMPIGFDRSPNNPNQPVPKPDSAAFEMLQSCRSTVEEFVRAGKPSSSRRSWMAYILS